MPHSRTNPSPEPHEETIQPRRAAWPAVAVVLLAVAAGAAGLSYVWNFDVHWHLASGEWMLQNGRVLGTDIFSVPDPAQPPKRWINVHWLFQVVAAGLHAVGGWELLSVLKSVMAVAAVLGLALPLRKRVPAGWLLFCGLMMVAAMIDRVRVRPEAFSLALLMWTVAIVESVRRGASARRLWWLAPMQIVWVNMQVLYILGLGVAWSAWLGALLDKRMGRAGLVGELHTRKALLPIVAATAACLISPWPLEAPMQAFMLYSNISGRTEYFTYGVSEFLPTAEALRGLPEAVVLGLLTFAAALVNVRALPAAHAVWIAAFTFLAFRAQRNVAMIGPVFGYLLAWHGGSLLTELTRRFRGLVRLAPTAAAATAVLALAVTAAFATEWAYRARSSDMRFGAGVLEQNYPVGVAKFLESSTAGGAVLCGNFGDAAVFIYYSRPRARPHRLVYLDGRLGLGVHSIERFSQVQDIVQELRTPELATRVSLPPAVRFLVIRHAQAEQLAAVAASPRFRLVCMDQVGACFARVDWAADLEGKELPASPNLDEFDRPLGPDGLVAGAAPAVRRWYRQNPHSRNCRLGLMMLYLGQEAGRAAPAYRNPLKDKFALLAVRYLTAARTEGLRDDRFLTGYLAQAYQQRALREDITLSAEVPVDVNLSQAMYQYRRFCRMDLDEPRMAVFLVQYIRALLQARQLDEADAAVAFVQRHLLPEDRVRPPMEYLQLRGIIATGLERARADAEKLAGLPMAERVEALNSPGVGLIDQAVAELKAAPQDAAAMLLGDLLLRKGMPDQARAAYPHGPASQSEAWKLTMRLALCDWVEGKLYPAEDSLRRLAADLPQPIACYYHAALLEQIGLYDGARAALEGVRSNDEQLSSLIDRLRSRLPGK